MKQLLLSNLLSILIAIPSEPVIAQETEQPSSTKCKWISDKGYWVIESNVNNKKSATIHFYNNDNTKVYSEKVEGKVVNINRRKTLLQLKQALDSSLLAWEASKKVNSDLVSQLLSAK